MHMEVIKISEKSKVLNRSNLARERCRTLLVFVRRLEVVRDLGGALRLMVMTGMLVMIVLMTQVMMRVVMRRMRMWYGVRVNDRPFSNAQGRAGSREAIDETAETKDQRHKSKHRDPRGDWRPRSCSIDRHSSEPTLDAYPNMHQPKRSIDASRLRNSFRRQCVDIKAKLRAALSKRPGCNT